MKSFFTRRAKPTLAKLPAGAFTLDQNGRVISSTLPGSFPEKDMLEIGARVLSFFRGAHLAQMPVQEFHVLYPNLKVTARFLRGGALIFLVPQTLTKTNL